MNNSGLVTTGPQALTVAQVAGIIASVVGRPISHDDIDRDAWIDGAIAAGWFPPATASCSTG
jgi:uncharacterized protein YbjT (DUF2867 family)